MNPTIAILGIIACAVVSAAGGSLFYFGLIPPKAKAAAKPAFTEHCIGKVTYIQFDNAVVTKLKPDGKIWTCGGV
jgi:hypothetical protein